MNKIDKAIQTLKENNFSNRNIILNINNEHFGFTENINNAFVILQKEFVTFDDKDFDKLVVLLYVL